MAKDPENIVQRMKDITLWQDINPTIIAKCWKNRLGDCDDPEDDDLLSLSMLRERLVQEKTVISSTTDAILELLNKSDTNVSL